MSRSVSRFAGLVVTLLIFTLALPGSPATAQATPTYEAIGSLRAPTVSGMGLTLNGFFRMCPGVPELQGHDAYIFEIPAEYASPVFQATVSSDGPVKRHDLDMLMASERCARLGSSNVRGKTSETAPIPEGTRYIVVWAWHWINQEAFVDLPIRLTIDPTPVAADPSPSAEPTAEPTPLYEDHFFFHRNRSFSRHSPTWNDSARRSSPLWFARAPGTIKELTLDLWYEQDAARTETLYVRAHTYEPYRFYALGSIPVSGSTEPQGVTGTFTNLDIPVDGGDIVVEIKSSSTTRIVSDSRQHPSGFTARIADWEDLDLPAPDQPRGDIVFEGEGDVEHMNPLIGAVGEGWKVGVTQREFLSRCAAPEEYQGFDAYVFELAAPTTGSEQATVFAKDGGGAQPAGYDLDAYFYDSECNHLTPNLATSSSDEFGALPVGTKWILAQLFSGRPLTMHTTVFEGGAAADPGSDPDPEDPDHYGSGTRGVYPLVPNDRFYGGVTPSENQPQQWGPRKINAPQAWQRGSATGDGIKVAVLDTGVDLQHPDLQCFEDKLGPGWDYSASPNDADPDDTHGHGTHVAGIIAACTDNNGGTVGVAPDATILPYRMIVGGPDDLLDMAPATRRAADDGAHVINMSFSSMYHPAGYISALPASVLHPINEAIDYATEKGVVVVAAAGNAGAFPTHGFDAAGKEFPWCAHPALSEETICVGATDPDDGLSSYSNRPDKFVPGKSPHVLVAPGGDGYCDDSSWSILSLIPIESSDECGFANGYAAYNGTSMASPHVAGVAALLYERLGGERTPCPVGRDIGTHPCAVDLIREALFTTTKDLGAPGLDPTFGWGLVDADAAVLSIPVAEEAVLSFDAPAYATRYTDGGEIGVRLDDASGNDLPGRNVEVTIGTGEGEAMTSTVITGDDGSAVISVPADLYPGAYTIRAHFAGEHGVYEPDDAVAGLSVDREVTATSLNVTGHGVNRYLDATLTEDDGAPVAAAEIVFSADGTEIGRANTDSNGYVSFAPPPQYRGGHFTFAATFAPTELFEGSTAEFQT